MVKVSVIMPVYNAERYLEEAINGILNQTLEDLELICVDDGSTDNSLKILKDFEKKDERIRIYHQENKGGGAARNVAMSHANGEYLYCMDADDMIESFALKECYDLANEKKVDFLMFQAYNYDMDTGKYKNYKIFSMDEIAEKVGENVFNYKDLGDLIFKTSSTPWCKFYNFDFVKKTGAQFAEGLIFHDNIFWWDILLNSERIYFYKKYLYTRRKHSKSSTGSRDERYIDAIKISDLIWDIFFKHDQFDNYKKGLFYRKFDKLYHWYKNINEFYKDEYFYALKENYENLSSDKEFYNYLLENLNEMDKSIFLNVLNTNTTKEFDKEIEISILRMENKKLKIKNRKLKKINNDLIASTSWKITKPLRMFKKKF